MPRLSKVVAHIPVITKVNKNGKPIGAVNFLQGYQSKSYSNPVVYPGMEENIFTSESIPLGEENYNVINLTNAPRLNPKTYKRNNNIKAYPAKEQWGKKVPLLENLERNNFTNSQIVPYKPYTKVNTPKINIKSVVNANISKQNNKYRQLQTTIKNTKMTNLNNTKKLKNNALQTKYNNIFPGNTRKNVTKLSYNNLLKERERKKKIESIFNNDTEKNSLSKQQIFDRMKTGTYPLEYVLNFFYYIETSILVGANIEPTVIKYINNPEKITEDEGKCLSYERKEFRKLIGEASREYKKKGIKSVDVQKAIIKLTRYFYDNYDNILTKMDMCDGNINQWMHHAESKYGDWYLKKKANEKKNTRWWKKLFR